MPARGRMPVALCCPMTRCGGPVPPNECRALQQGRSAPPGCCLGRTTRSPRARRSWRRAQRGARGRGLRLDRGVGCPGSPRCLLCRHRGLPRPGPQLHDPESSLRRSRGCRRVACAAASGHHAALRPAARRCEMHRRAVQPRPARRHPARRRLTNRRPTKRRLTKWRATKWRLTKWRATKWRATKRGGTKRRGRCRRAAQKRPVRQRAAGRRAERRRVVERRGAWQGPAHRGWTRRRAHLPGRLPGPAPSLQAGPQRVTHARSAPGAPGDLAGPSGLGPARTAGSWSGRDVRHVPGRRPGRAAVSVLGSPLLQGWAPRAADRGPGRPGGLGRAAAATELDAAGCRGGADGSGGPAGTHGAPGARHARRGGAAPGAAAGSGRFARCDRRRSCRIRSCRIRAGRVRSCRMRSRRERPCRERSRRVPSG
jgi:hypothetical protein